MEDQPTPQNTFERKEIKMLSFEEGLAESLRKIKEILKNKDSAVVAFFATGRGVGKSTLATRIADSLRSDHVLGYIEHTPEDLEESDFESIEWLMSERSLGKVVFIFNQCDWDYLDTAFRLKYDEIVEKALEDTKWKTDKIDLWIGISTPSQPFFYKALSVDILICNELAKKE